MIVVFLLNGYSPSKLINTANEELKRVVKWLNINKLSLNLDKCKYILFSRKGTTSICKDNVCINNSEIGQVSQVNILGYIIDEKLSWKEHVSYISLKVSKNIAVLRKLLKTLNRENLYNLYYSLIYSYLINGITVWGASGSSTLAPLVTLQKKVVRILTQSGRIDHTLPLFKNLNILPLNWLYVYNKYVFKVRNGRLPEPSTTDFVNYQAPNSDCSY